MVKTLPRGTKDVRVLGVIANGERDFIGVDKVSQIVALSLVGSS